MATTPKAIIDLKAKIRTAAVPPHNAVQVVMNGLLPLVLIGGEGHGDDFRAIVPNGSTRGMTWAEMMTQPFIKREAPYGWVYVKWGHIECWIPAAEGDTPDPEPCIRTGPKPGSGGWYFQKCIRPRVPGSDLCAKHKSADDRATARVAADLATRRVNAMGGRLADQIIADQIITDLQTLAHDGWNRDHAVTILTDLIVRAAALEKLTDV